MRGWLSSLVSLLYPPSCAVCGEVLVAGEEFICTRCRHDLPHDRGEHGDLELKFAGACRITPMYALLRYRRKSPFRLLVLKMKYRGNRKLGVFLGKMIGERIKGKFAAEMIVPVPLHPKRQRQRGFNQSALLASGIAPVVHLPVREDVIRRVVNNRSQTGLSPGERARNAERLFEVTAREALEGKHVMLVDDVVTTGSTITDCLRALGSVPGIRVSVVCLSRAGLS
ncbi:MAG: ComF family protein [Odoribacteraceae bacterium]|jgi:ComF family protein|nr:ComF family protein [Odoribacteraceae bacterium]